MTMTLNEAQAWLEQMASEIEQWEPKALEEARRLAVSFSPVVTGSYAASHRVVGYTLAVDQGARNAITGASVSAYAGAVEAAHHVYSRVAAKLPGMVEREALSMLDRITQ